MQSSSGSIGILGLGAIGTLMASHWRSLNLYAVGRSDDAFAQQTPLIRELLQPDGSIQTLELPRWRGEPLDWLLVTTKAADTLAALKPWQSQLAKVKRLLLLQNGMGQQAEVYDWLGQSSQTNTCELWLGISTEGAYRESTERIVYAGKGEILIGAGFEPHRSSRTFTKGSNAADEAKRPEPHPLLPSCRQVADIWQPVREKLAINAVINPLTARFQCLNGELVSHSEYRQSMLALCDEIQSLYDQLNWRLSFELQERALAVAEATAANRSSSLQDRIAGRKTELDYICGYLLNQAEASSTRLPITETLLQELNP